MCFLDIATYRLPVPIMKSILLLLAALAVAQAGVSVTLSSADISAFLKSHNDVRSALGIPSLVSRSRVVPQLSVSFIWNFVEIELKSLEALFLPLLSYFYMLFVSLFFINMC